METCRLRRAKKAPKPQAASRSSRISQTKMAKGPKDLGAPELVVAACVHWQGGEKGPPYPMESLGTWKAWKPWGSFLAELRGPQAQANQLSSSSTRDERGTDRTNGVAREKKNLPTSPTRTPLGSRRLGPLRRRRRRRSSVVVVVLLHGESCGLFSSRVIRASLEGSCSSEFQNPFIYKTVSSPFGLALILVFFCSFLSPFSPYPK